MFVARFTSHAKQGCTNELVELAKSMLDYVPAPPHGWRVYWHTQFSPADVVITEFEFESMVEQETWWKEQWAARRFREWLDKVRKLTERGGGGEFWTMAQLG